MIQNYSAHPLDDDAHPPSVEPIQHRFLDEFPAVGDISDASQFLGERPEFIRELCRTGQLRAFKCGKHWKIPRDWIADYICNASGSNSSLTIS